MNIKNRLTFISSLIFGVVFTLASGLVYWMFIESSEKVILDQLEKTAKLTALFYLEEDELPRREHRKIKREFQEQVLNIEVRVFNEEDSVRYGIQEEDSAITEDMLNRIREKKETHFKIDEYYYYGIFYPDNQGDFVVLLKENRDFFHVQSDKLLFILSLVLIGGLVAILVLSKLLSHIAYRPVQDVVKQVNEIDPQSLPGRIDSKGTNDEVQMLIDTFNDLLKRLSENFEMQKNFINYFSHEVKTPLASISGNMQIFRNKERSPEEYQKLSREAIENVRRIEEIMNTLMVISGLRTSGNSKEKFRADELIWNVLERFEPHIRKSVTVSIEIEADQKELLLVKGSKMQVQPAVQNLIENAYKFSNGSEVKLRLFESNQKPVLTIYDTGIGIPAEDLQRIEEPFFRSENARKINGSGMGFAVASAIFKHNNIKSSVRSELNKFTEVRLEFELARSKPADDNEPKTPSKHA